MFTRGLQTPDPRRKTPHSEDVHDDDEWEEESNDDDDDDDDDDDEKTKSFLEVLRNSLLRSSSSLRAICREDALQTKHRRECRDPPPSFWSP